MKTCKIKPDRSVCSACLSAQEMYGEVEDCRCCTAGTQDEYELLQIGTGFWSGDYATVQKDGIIKRVSLSDIYDVKEKNDK